MAETTLSSAVRTNLLSLQSTANALAKTQEKLATGLKVNSALDDPTAFFTASSLNSRANDLSRLQDFVGNSVQTLKAADEGIAAITKLVENAEATARQALNSSGESASSTGTTDISSKTAFTQVAQNTGTAAVTDANFNDFNSSVESSGFNFSTANFDLTSSITAGGAAFGTTAAVSKDEAGNQFTVAFDADGAGAGTAVTATVTLTGGEDAADIATKINEALEAQSTGIVGTGAGQIQAADNAGQLRFTVEDGSTATVAITDVDAGAAAAVGLSTGTILTEDGVGAGGNTVDGSGGFTDTGTIDFANDGDTFTISDGVNTTADITLAGGDTVANVKDKIDAALTAASITDITSSLGTNGVDLASDNGRSIKVTDTNSGGGAAAALGLSTTESVPADDGSIAGLDAGDSFTINGTTITYGGSDVAADGEFNTKEELETLIDAIDGLSAKIDGTGNLEIAGDGVDIVIDDDDTNGLAQTLGLASGTAAETTKAQNTLTVANGDSFAIEAGGNSAVTITFGDGDGEVNTRAELTTALQNVDGIASAEFDANDNLVIKSDDSTSFTLTDTDGALAKLGVTDAATVVQGDVGVQSGDAFTVQVGGAAAETITFGSGANQVDTSQELVNALNEIDNIRASISDDGGLEIKATNGEDLTLANSNNSPLSELGLSATTIEASENDDRTSFAQQYNELRTQINELTADAGYNGNNLLAGDSVTVTFNEDATSTLTIEGVNFNANGLGIGTSQNSFQTDADIQTALSELNTATSTLRAQASKFGSNLSVVETRQDFTKNLINVLETGAANLTLADTNEEGANLLALQTRQQLSSTALSLASQADQNVLRLF